MIWMMLCSQEQHSRTAAQQDEGTRPAALTRALPAIEGGKESTVHPAYQGASIAESAQVAPADGPDTAPDGGGGVILPLLRS